MVSEKSECQLRDHPYFENSKEEASYWKTTAEDHLQKLQDVRDEFEEFQEGSRELEAELETQLEQYEARVRDLIDVKTKLEEENEVLKEKLVCLEQTSYTQVTQLQDENVQIKAVRDEMSKYIRELEQSNDDLERAKRSTISSLESFDARLNNAIERNAFLENELEEKEQLIITVQRLKDESRDLKSELAINSVESNTTLSESKLRLEETKTNNDKLSENRMNTTTAKVHHPSLTSEAVTNTSKIQAIRNSNTMMPSTRISALNIVSDLLRKVGALESKLATCRNFVQEHPPSSKNNIVQNVMKDSSSVNAANNISSPTSGLVKVNV